MIKLKLFLLTIFLLITIIFSLHLIKAQDPPVPHWIAGIVNNASDGTSPDDLIATLYWPGNQSDNETDTIGPNGNSSTSNMYMIDCEMLDTPCDVGENLTIEVFQQEKNGKYYYAGPVNVTVTVAGWDQAPNMTLTLDFPPSVYLEAPTNNTLNTTDNTPDFIFNVTDDIASTLDCYLWLRNSSNSNVSYGRNSTTLNATSTTITANASLANGDYLWWVNCSDGVNTNISEKRNISIQTGVAVTEINFTISSLTWGVGSVNSGCSNATLDSSGAGSVTCGSWTAVNGNLILENIGGTDVTIDIKSDINATSMFGGTSPSLQWNSTQNEENSCTGAINVTNLFTTSWADVNTSSPDGTRFCATFDATDASDTIAIAFRLVIPSDTTVSDSRSVIITAKATSLS